MIIAPKTLTSDSLRVSDHLNHSRVVLEASSGTAWDSWGLRDPAVLMTADGKFAEVDNCLQMFFTGSCEQGLRQSVGRASSRDQGNTWEKTPRPTLEPRVNSWDGSAVGTPWGVVDGDIVRLYYRGLNRRTGEQGIGLAVGSTIEALVRYGDKPLVTGHAFTALSGSTADIGVVNVTKSSDNDWLMLFEGYDTPNGIPGSIYAMSSPDGYSFQRWCGRDEPFFSSESIQVIKGVRHVCNPRLTRLRDGRYLLGYNFARKGDYAIGFSVSDNLEDWHEIEPFPLLYPTSIPSQHPFSGRLEGPVVDLALLEQRSEVRFFFMAIPREASNHQRGVIALFENGRVVSDQENSLCYWAGQRGLGLLEHISNFNSDLETSSVLRAKRIDEPIRFCLTSNRSELILDIEQPKIEKSSVVFHIGENFHDFTSGNGTALLIDNGRIYVANGSKRSRYGTIFNYLCYRLSIRMTARHPISRFVLHQAYGFKRLDAGARPCVRIKVRLALVEGSEEVQLSTNDEQTMTFLVSIRRESILTVFSSEDSTTLNCYDQDADCM